MYNLGSDFINICIFAVNFLIFSTDNKKFACNRNTFFQTTFSWTLLKTKYFLYFLYIGIQISNVTKNSTTAEVSLKKPHKTTN